MRDPLSVDATRGAYVTRGLRALHIGTIRTSRACLSSNKRRGAAQR
jgi:hypothetical protein